MFLKMKLYLYSNCVHMLNWIFKNRTDYLQRITLTNGDGTHLSSCVQKIWSLSFLLATSSISIRTTSWQFLNLITYTQRVVSMLGSTYRYEQLFFKIKHAKSMLHSQLSNHHLYDVSLWSTSSFNPNPVSWRCRIHQLHLCREVKPPPLTNPLDMTLSHLTVRVQSWSFEE